MIRKYEENEIPHLVNIWDQAASLAHPFLPVELHQTIKKAMNDMYLPNSNTWVYEEDGQVLGFVSMLKNEIAGLFVLPDMHGKGIGTSLVNHVSEQHDTLEVEVFEENKIGKPFYMSKGFKVIKEYIFDGTDQNVLRMRNSGS